MRPELAIEVRDLVKTFPMSARDAPARMDRLRPVRRARRGELRVLDGISFEVEVGEFIGIVGPNGCGKSTLIRMLANIYAPDSGSIHVRGRVAPVVELGVGFNNEHSAATNVVLSGVMLGLPRAEVQASVEGVLKHASLERFAEMPLKNFSSGMRTRLAFAISMLARPDVMLLDEVLAVGDRAFQEQCLEELQERQLGGVTVVLVSHSLDKVARYCDRALLLDQGRIQADGPPDEIARALHASEATPAPVQPIKPKSPLAPGAPKLESFRLADGAEDPIPRRERILADAVFHTGEGVRTGIMLRLRDGEGTLLFAALRFPGGFDHDPGEGRHEVEVRIQNPLAAGEYELSCTAATRLEDGSLLHSEPRFISLAIGGPPSGAGVLALGCAVKLAGDEEGSDS